MANNDIGAYNIVDSIIIYYLHNPKVHGAKHIRARGDREQRRVVEKGSKLFSAVDPMRKLAIDAEAAQSTV
ncbi:hypothetical protein DPMN_190364 [Dreissena polymorpha]|uniref:Uncharacterized protein n=1 Tax=Dreissena polymorpha TaxID=45954 RepID=A0A9D4IAB5_DREPO|nr:hypothetical protein DPMN_190364 [Dreissena polymorpha]